MNIENMSQDWKDGKKMKEYHERHLHSIKLATHINKESKKKKNGDDHDENGDNTFGGGKKKTTKTARGDKCSLSEHLF